jgi:hypothetical protein
MEHVMYNFGEEVFPYLVWACVLIEGKFEWRAKARIFKSKNVRPKSLPLEYDFVQDASEGPYIDFVVIFAGRLPDFSNELRGPITFRPSGITSRESFLGCSLSCYTKICDFPGLVLD